MMEVLDALNTINPACDREAWVRVLMSIKSEFGNDGIDIAKEWSSQAETYNPKDFLATWRSIRENGGVSIGTLLYEAKKNGWHPKPSDGLSYPSPPQPKNTQEKTPSTTFQYAQKIWNESRDDDRIVSSHYYAIRKGINWAAGASRGTASGRLIGCNADCVIVPIRHIETGEPQGVQCINAEGKKQTFGNVSGGCLLLGNTLDKTLPWYVCEGWASAVSMVFHHSKGNAVCAVSFGKHQLEKVAVQIASVYQPKEVVILQEVDK